MTFCCKQLESELRTCGSPARASNLKKKKSWGRQKKGGSWVKFGNKFSLLLLNWQMSEVHPKPNDVTLLYAWVVNFACRKTIFTNTRAHISSCFCASLQGHYFFRIKKRVIAKWNVESWAIIMRGSWHAFKKQHNFFKQYKPNLIE
jgi:hypothetical protein